MFDELMNVVDQVVGFHGEREGEDAKAYSELEKHVESRLLQFYIALLDHDLANNQ